VTNGTTDQHGPTDRGTLTEGDHGVHGPLHPRRIHGLPVRSRPEPSDGAAHAGGYPFKVAPCGRPRFRTVPPRWGLKWFWRVRFLQTWRCLTELGRVERGGGRYNHGDPPELAPGRPPA
jgi:hypothetical protein